MRFGSKHRKDLKTADSSARSSYVQASPSEQERDSMPLSYGQKLLWNGLSHVGSAEPNQVQLRLKLACPVSLSRLEAALVLILQSHDSLRARMSWENGSAGQQFETLGGLTLLLLDLGDLPSECCRSLARFMSARHRDQPMDLESGPLFRFLVIDMGDENRHLVITLHRLVCDHQSLSIFLNHLELAYGDPQPEHRGLLGANRSAFDDWVKREERGADGPALKSRLKRWCAYLSGNKTPLQLPTNRPRSYAMGRRGASAAVHLPGSLCRGLRSQYAQTPLRHILAAAFQALLCRIGCETDGCLGLSVANRQVRGSESLIGRLGHILVVRLQVEAGWEFGAVLGQFLREKAEADSLGLVPYSRLAPALTSDSPSPVHVVFGLQDPLPATAPAGVGSSLLVDGNRSLEFDLQVVPEQRLGQGPDQGLIMRWHYPSELFDSSTIRALGARYLSLTKAILACPRRPIGDLSLLTSEDRRKLLGEWNPPLPIKRKFCPVQRLFESRAAQGPDRVVLTSSRRTLSYGWLNGAANQLAATLGTLGVGPETMVAVCMPRCPDMVVAILAVLKTGGAYLPLDPGYPETRIAFMLNDAQAPVVIVRHGEVHPGCRGPWKIVALKHGSLFSQEPESYDPDQLARASGPDSGPEPQNAAYMVYTSGSTGKPKGVMVSHESLTHLVAWHCDTYRLSAQDRTSWLAGPAFDASVWELWPGLTRGASLHIPKTLALFSAQRLWQWFAAQGISLSFCPTPLAQELLAYGSPPKTVLRALLTGGEKLGRLPDPAFPVPFFDHYGPTENTVVATQTRVSGEPDRPAVGIGRPLSHVRIFLLSRRGQLVPPGTEGEIAIGGGGLARGYYGRPRTTAEKFIPNAFGGPGERLYLSGDLARHLDNGALEFRGRLDHQIKLRGFRIETGEIESALRDHGLVKEAVVLLRRDPATPPRLVAYLLANVPVIAPDVLRSHLQNRLPEYMIPAHFVVLERLPITANGKIDRRALPLPEQDGELPAEGFRAPTNSLEELLATLWSELLGDTHIGLDTNFFHQGGHSLLATRLLSRIHNLLGVHLPLRHFFEQPTLGAFADAVARAREREMKPIPCYPRRETLPLSFAQQRLWFIQQLDPDQTAYSVPLVFQLKGSLDLDALEQSLRRVHQRHETLRTRFPEVDGEPVQEIHPARGTALSLVDLRHSHSVDEDAEKLALAEATRAFDMVKGPLWRCCLLRLEEDRHLFLFTIHHIIFDGWSLDRFMAEWGRGYRHFLGWGVSPQKPLEIQYADFAQWQQKWALGASYRKQLQFWQRQLDALPQLAIPTDFSRPKQHSFEGGDLTFQLSAQLTSKLRHLAGSQGATLFMTLLTAYKLLLSRYSGQTDVVVGTPIANRNRRELEHLIGFFANTLVLRTELGPAAGDSRAVDPGFCELLRRVRHTTLAAYEHQDLPFEQLVAALQPDRELNRNPLFEHMFTLRHHASGQAGFPGVSFSTLKIDRKWAHFDLSLSMEERGGELHGCLTYKTALYQPQTPRRMMAHWVYLMNAIVENPDLPVRDFVLMNPQERAQILVEWNQSEAPFPRDGCLEKLFERHAAQTGDRIALTLTGVDGATRAVSYGDLDGMADLLAARLRRKGVGPEVPVGLYFEDALATTVAVIAVWKAGGCFVPLDKDIPGRRCRFILKDSQAKVLLAGHGMAERIFTEPSPISLLEVGPWGRSVGKTAKRENRAEPTNIAYILYTSGSTGKPKGVRVIHRSVVNYLTWFNANFPQLRPLPTTTKPIFDASLRQYLAPLVSGNTAWLLSQDATQPHQLMKAVAIRGPVTLSCVPSLWRVVLESQELQDPDRERVGDRVWGWLSGGEALEPSLLQQTRNRLPRLRIWNCYGPTETTVNAIVGPVEYGETITLGRPLANTRIYVLDNFLQPVPIGVVGNLFIAGTCLARDYAGRPSLTAASFSPDPFAFQGGGRLYQTGDRVRYLSDGRVQYCGRRDGQVKLRGHRVELAEIEAALIRHEEIDEVLVTLPDTPAPSGERCLAAWYVAGGKWPPAALELRAFLEKVLPSHMIPTVFTRLSALPLTPTGKVDRRALPELDWSFTTPDRAFVPPRSPLEEELAAIWADVLGIPRVGSYDQFFHLGGHSLLATRVISRVRQGLKTAVSLATLFENPTLHLFAKAVREAGKESEDLRQAAILPVPRQGTLPLSFSQQRLWFIDQLDPGNPAYKIPFAYRVSEFLDPLALESGINQISRRHEVFRTAIVVKGDEPALQIEPPQPMALTVVDFSALEESDRQTAISRLAAAHARIRLRMERGHLWQACIFRLPDCHLLNFAVHHIIFDAWSKDLFLKELGEAYTARCRRLPEPFRPPLLLQYADYASWQRQWLNLEHLESQLKYWTQQLDGAPDLRLPLDHPRPRIQRLRGAAKPFHLTLDLSQRLGSFCHREGVTLFMGLLAAFKVLLMRYSGQTDISVGTPIANRNRSELEDMIGFFVNTLVLRTRVHEEADLQAPSFRQILVKVQETALGAYEHQDLPFEKLVEVLQPSRQLDRTPLFQVVFTLHHAGSSEQVEHRGLLALEPFEIQHRLVHHDLGLGFSTSAGDGRLAGQLVYKSDLFDRQTVARMAGHFKVLLEQVIQFPDRPMSQLSLLTAEERDLVLFKWNQPREIGDETRCLHELFEAQAARCPDGVALEFTPGVNVPERQVTYGLLARLVAKTAAALVNRGVRPDELVAISYPRSLELVVGMIAIWKAGAAFLPLDETLPWARQRFMLTDGGVRLWLTPEIPSKMPASTTNLGIDISHGEPSKTDCDRFGTASCSAMSAYQIYTSGSSGTPKGVRVSHHAAVSFLTWFNRRFPDLPPMPTTTKLLFDMSLKQLVAPLLRGRAVWLLDDGVTAQVDTLLAAMGSRPKVVVNCVPSLWRAFLDFMDAGSDPNSGSTIRYWFSGGEALDENLVTRTLKRFPSLEIRNFYGPTETTVNVTMAAVDPKRPVTIGRPFGDTRVYLLDSRLEPVPIGITGSLAIGGAGLARGYLHRPGLTACHFVPNPFGGAAGDRLYLSGDLGRFSSHGDIHFSGRSDRQIKLRGFRLEPGEVERVLTRHSTVAEAVVGSYQSAGTTAEAAVLLAWVVPEKNTSPDPRILASFLGDRLPPPMIPNEFVFMEALPLTPTGKVDRKGLPGPRAGIGFCETDAEPRSPLELELSQIWVEVLGRKRIGVHDNFFAVGGHSLRATQVISRVRASLQVDLPLRTLFERPTIAGLVQAIEQRGDKGALSEEPRFVQSKDSTNTPLSFAQKRLWFIDRLEPGNAAYNISYGFHMEGPLHLKALQQSLRLVVARHDSLRTSFDLVEGEPVQVVAAPVPFEMPLLDLSRVAAETKLILCQSLADQEARRCFHLHVGPLWRCALLRLSPQEHVLLLTMHHIVSDGWSKSILMRELRQFYGAFSRGLPMAPKPLPFQYVDFTRWQHQWLQGKVLQSQLDYWRKRLHQIPELDLPCDRPRPEKQIYRGQSLNFSLSPELTQRLLKLGRAKGITLFMALLAAFRVLLFRYTQQADVAIGTPIANRNRREIEGLIGFFINTLVLRTDLSNGGDGNAGLSFNRLLKREQETALGAYEHQDLPFEKLVEELHPHRNLSLHPLFQVVFMLQNTPSAEPSLAGLTLKPLQRNRDAVHFDLALGMRLPRSPGEGLKGEFGFNTALFDAETIDRMAGHFKNVLVQVCRDSEQLITADFLLDANEKEALLRRWQGPWEALPHFNLAQCFEQQVDRSPFAVALRFQHRAFSYQALNQRANRLARRLMALGVGPECPVAIRMNPSAERVIAQLAILKAGGAYVPLDPDHPQSRQGFMIEDSGARWLMLSGNQDPKAVHWTEAQRVMVHSGGEDLEAYGDTNPGLQARADQMAYIIYTSGSTGQPKGVTGLFGNTYNRLSWMWAAYPFQEGEVSCHQVSLSFVDAVWELFGPLLKGVPVVIVPQETRKDPDLLLPLLAAHGVSRLVLVPSLLAGLLEREANSCRPPTRPMIWIASGEALPAKLVTSFFRRFSGHRLLNLYGSSEVAGDVTAFDAATGEISSDPMMPIGRPITNVRIVVSDPRLQPVPVGIKGEIAVGGTALARGFHRRSALTAARFVPDPFSGKPGARLFRTGDLGRITNEGFLMFSGRADHQVKLRGFRIELGEIETVLRKHPKIKEAAVVLHRNHGNDASLVGFVVAHAEGIQPGGDATRSYLRRHLPDPMVPLLVWCPQLPRTVNGKVDRSALLQRDISDRQTKSGAVRPVDGLSLQLACIWQDVLDLNFVGIHDNFFDLGGHSLLAVRLLDRIERRMGKKLPLTAIFQFPTIHQMRPLLADSGQVETWPLLAPMQLAGKEPPFFCVHPLGGTVFPYVNVARLLQVPFYGIQSPGLDGSRDPFTRIEKMAAHYVAAIREKQPQGPYRIGGWSLGGMIAYEMARQLHNQGQEVGLLAILDTYPNPSRPQCLGDDLLNLFLFGNLKTLYGFEPKLTPAEQAALGGLFVNRSQDDRIEVILEFFAPKLPPEIRPDQVRALWRVFKANHESLVYYKPKPFGGTIDLFSCQWPTPNQLNRVQSDQNWRRSKDRQADFWRALSDDRVRVTPVPGHHLSLMEIPHAETLARELRQRLRSKAQD